MLGNGLYVLGNGLHLLGNGPHVLCKSTLGIMLHSGLCRLGLCHIPDYVILDYVAFGIMSHSVLCHLGLCRSC